MNHRRRTLALLAALAGTLALAGCREQSASEAAAEQAARRAAARKERGLIAFVGASDRDPLWPVLKASAQRYDRRMCTLDVGYFCPRNDSPQEQIDLIRALPPDKLRGLCLRLSNSAALERTLRDLHNAGVQIVSMIAPAPEEIRAAHVGFDETEVGMALARAAADAVGPDGTIALLHAGMREPGSAARLSGFGHEMGRHRAVEVLAEIDCQADPFAARKEMADYLRRFPRLSAFVSLDDWAFRDLNSNGQPLPAGGRLVTFGAYPEQWPLIRDGTLPVVVAANYREMGAQALQACEIATRAAARIKPLYLAPPRTVTADNLDAFIADWNAWLRQNDELPPNLPTTRPGLPMACACMP